MAERYEMSKATQQRLEQKVQANRESHAIEIWAYVRQHAKSLDSGAATKMIAGVIQRATEFTTGDYASAVKKGANDKRNATLNKEVKKLKDAVKSSGLFVVKCDRCGKPTLGASRGEDMPCQKCMGGKG